MSWIKKSEDVEVVKELEFDNSRISVSNAYEVEITGARLQEAKDESSKSVSLVIDVKNEDGDSAREYFTIFGRDGEPYFIDKRNNVKKQHIGLTIVNTAFKIALGKEIFDIEPSEIEYEVYNQENKEKETLKGDGFPELIGKKIGVCVQMVREIQGSDSKETPTIEHFFDHETGLFDGEDGTAKVNKLNKWLDKMKEFKEVIKEEPKKANWGGKKEDSKAAEKEEPKKSKWGR